MEGIRPRFGNDSQSPDSYNVRPVESQIPHVSDESIQRSRLETEFLNLSRLYSASFRENQSLAMTTYNSAVQLFQGAMTLYNIDIDQDSYPLIRSMMDQASVGLNQAQAHGFQLSIQEIFDFELFYGEVIFEECRICSEGHSSWDQEICLKFQSAIDRFIDLLTKIHNTELKSNSHLVRSHLGEVHEFYGYYLLRCGKAEDGIFQLNQFLTIYEQLEEANEKFHYDVDLLYVYEQLSAAYEVLGDAAKKQECEVHIEELGKYRRRLSFF